VEIGSSPIEKAIRSTAIGKKNWLFVGGEDTEGRSAVIYTLIESARRHGRESYAFPKNLLEWVPGMKAGVLLPANWKPASQAVAPG
jgi:transposase